MPNVVHRLMRIREFSIIWVICFLQWRLVETMRASVVLLFAFLALAFVVAYAADEVSIHANIVFPYLKIV